MPVINVNDVALGYQEFGNREKHTVVLAHPIPWGYEVFNHLISQLADDYHVVALDVHGHGNSGYRSPLVLEEMAEDFHELLTRLNLSNFTWIGYSVGGMIGMHFALKYPKMIDSLVLIATAARLDVPEATEQALMFWKMFRDGQREEIADAALPFFLAPATFKNQPELVWKYRSKMIIFSKSEGEGMYEAARASMVRTDIGEQIGAIKVPTLLIAGRDDMSTTAAEAEFIAEQIQNARVKIFEDTSHLLVIEKPQEVTEVISKFLKEKRDFS